MLRRLTLALVLLAPAPAALAGPVPTPLFSYAVSAVTPSGGDKAYLGSIRGYDQDDTATDWAVVAPLPAVPGRAGEAPGDATSGSLDLGGLSKGIYSAVDLATPAGQALGAPDRSFKLLVSVTDGASGQVGVAEFDGRFGYIYGDGSPPHVDVLASATGTATLYLGTNIYTFTAENRESESNTYLGASYMVTALETTTTANTPEPATLVSAALGLATVVGAARRRRQLGDRA